MRAATHLAFAGLTGVVASGFGAEPGVAGAAALAAGSLLPDLDTQHSGFGRMVKPLSGRLERRFGHRTITHSLLGLVIVGSTAELVTAHQPKGVDLAAGRNGDAYPARHGERGGGSSVLSPENAVLAGE